MNELRNFERPGFPGLIYGLIDEWGAEGKNLAGVAQGDYNRKMKGPQVGTREIMEG